VLVSNSIWVELRSTSSFASYFSVLYIETTMCIHPKAFRLEHDRVSLVFFYTSKNSDGAGYFSGI
jgi:hypothetical protein